MRKNKKIISVLLCAILAAALSLQSFAADLKFEEYAGYYSAAGLKEDELKKAKEDKSISPEIDELLELYMDYSLYGLNREQAILEMLRKFIIDYDAVPLLANSLLTAFDPFAGYYTATSMGEMFGDLYRGYGFAFGGKNLFDGHLYNATIKKVFPGSPAEGSGLQAGDEFIKVNGINVEGMGVAAVSNLLASIENKVNLVMKRGESEVSISLEKGTVAVSSLTCEMPSDKTAVITLENWTDDAAVYDFYMWMLYLEQEKYENLIIDLRENGGGDVVIMANILDMLVTKKDMVMFSFKDREGKIDSLVSSGEGFAFKKIAVLVNENTASASEIFSLSLKEITGAVIIGSQTFGKGIGQDYIELENGDVAAITSFELVSHKGASYHGKGITPDITIKPVYKNVESKKLEQLNFVNCVNIKEGADNKAVLALNQRLALMGYLQPKDVTSKLTSKTITAVEIFQKFDYLPVGITKIDYRFIEVLNYRASFAPSSYEESDVVLECANEYITKDKKAAEVFAEKLKK